jgi:iron complex transport system substrate-binding protein
MKRRGRWAGYFALVSLGWLFIVGCDRGATPAASGGAKGPTIASLVPAATDLLIGMGAADHLAAVSDYDQAPEVAKLPRIGAYQTIDWEKLAAVKPNVIVSFYGPGHTPAGFVEKIAELKIQNVNVRLDRLDDIYAGLATLGEVCHEPEKAAEEEKRIRNGIDQVRRRVAGRKPVRAIIASGESGAGLAGRETFLNDLLEAAGGENALTVPNYVTLDREALAALRPEVILQLLPGADQKTVAQARAAWEGLAQMPAVREHRVWIFTDSTIMQPGSHVAQAAAKFAEAMHATLSQKEPESRSSTTQAGS